MRRFDLEEIESIGIGGQAELSGYVRGAAQAVVIASDRQVVSVGVGLTSAERAWLAGYLTQAVAAK